MLVSELVSLTIKTSNPAAFKEEKGENKFMKFNALDYTNLANTLANTNTREENEKKQRIADRKEYVVSLCKEMVDAGVFADMEGLYNVGKIAKAQNCLRMHRKWEDSAIDKYKKLSKIMYEGDVWFYEYKRNGEIEIISGDSWRVILSSNGRVNYYYVSEGKFDKVIKCVEWFRDNYEKIRDIELEYISSVYNNRIIAEDCVR